MVSELHPLGFFLPEQTKLLIGKFSPSYATLVDELLLPEYPERYVAYSGTVVL